MGHRCGPLLSRDRHQNSGCARPSELIGIPRRQGAKIVAEFAAPAQVRSGTNETKEPRRISSAYPGKADSMLTTPFSP